TTCLSGTRSPKGSSRPAAHIVHSGAPATSMATLISCSRRCAIATNSSSSSSSAVAASRPSRWFSEHRRRAHPPRARRSHKRRSSSAHRDEVAFVTIDIGANDLSDSDIVTYLPQILDGLRAAAGPGVPIIGMSYYAGGLPDVWNQTHDLTAVQN